MKIMINGRCLELAGPVSIVDLLAMQKVKYPEGVLVYINHRLFLQEDYETAYLKDKDVIEIHYPVWGI